MAEVSVPKTVTEDVNEIEKVDKRSNSSDKSGNMSITEENATESETFENSKEETDVTSYLEKDESVANSYEEIPSEPAEMPEAPALFVPKYNYIPGQWSPSNTSGKKCYDVGLLKQMKEDPLSKDKPDAPLLEACEIMRTTPASDFLSFTTMSRPMNDSLFPQFAKSSESGSRSIVSRDQRKDGRNMSMNGKGSLKLAALPGRSGSHKNVTHVSLSMREEIKLNETENPWKPQRFKKNESAQDDVKTQEVYQKFRGILNKLTPQKFLTLLEKVKTLEINNQKCLEGVVDLIFEKAIEEPNFSKAYAVMCSHLLTLKVPADNQTHPDQFVNFRVLIINKCQSQFITDKVDEQILKLEKDLADCSDPDKKKELELMLEEENRRVRMRSVGNVRFIGELYKLKMLTPKIMVYCMNYLIKHLEEEKLECLCKLLTTIGQQVESEAKEQLDSVFKKMQDIVDRKSNKISSRVRFMIQDVIELRRRRWVAKSVVDSQPKTLDQIQKETEQKHRDIELMNASPGGFRRDDGGRGKRGDSRKGVKPAMNNNNNWKTPRQNYTVDTSKLKAVTHKNIGTIKLAPQNLGWNHGSSTKNTAQVGSNSMISLTKTNMFSVLENDQSEPAALKGNKDLAPTYHTKGASIEGSTFNSRADFGSGTRSGSIGVPNPITKSASISPSVPDKPEALPTQTSHTPQERLPDDKRKSVKSMIDLSLINPDDEEISAEVKQLFPPQYHADVVSEILNIALEKNMKEFGMISDSLLHLVSTNTISPENFLSGMKEICEFAPDLFIDIPKVYEHLGKIFAMHIEKKHITFAQAFNICENVISSNQGHLLLEAIIKELKNSMGPSFVKNKWQESGLKFEQWMNEEKVAKWIEDNKFEFLEVDVENCGDTKKTLSPSETHRKLMQLMKADESYDCIKDWVKDNLGPLSNDDWFMRVLTQAIFEHAMLESEREGTHFNLDRMNAYSRLILEFGGTQQAREASCLFAIQQLVHKLEHPKGLTLEIFQYLHEQYIISPEGFIAWEESEKEPEGKAVMMKGLTSFFINIREADNEDSCSEE